MVLITKWMSNGLGLNWMPWFCSYWKVPMVWKWTHIYIFNLQAGGATLTWFTMCITCMGFQHLVKILLGIIIKSFSLLWKKTWLNISSRTCVWILILRLDWMQNQPTRRWMCAALKDGKWKQHSIDINCCHSAVDTILDQIFDIFHFCIYLLYVFVSKKNIASC